MGQFHISEKFQLEKKKIIDKVYHEKLFLFALLPFVYQSLVIQSKLFLYAKLKSNMMSEKLTTAFQQMQFWLDFIYCTWGLYFFKAKFQLHRNKLSVLSFEDEAV